MYAQFRGDHASPEPLTRSIVNPAALRPRTWQRRIGGGQAAGEFELRLDTRSVGLAVVPDGRDLAYLDGLGDPLF